LPLKNDCQWTDARDEEELLPLTLCRRRRLKGAKRHLWNIITICLSEDLESCMQYQRLATLGAVMAFMNLLCLKGRKMYGQEHDCTRCTDRSWFLWDLIHFKGGLHCACAFHSHWSMRVNSRIYYWSYQYNPVSSHESSRLFTTSGFALAWKSSMAMGLIH